MTLGGVYAAAGLTVREEQSMAEHLDFNDEFYNTSAYDKLYEYFVFVVCEMPYGTAKARDGDPDVWILERLESLI
jgi:hypothetical protein